MRKKNKNADVLSREFVANAGIYLDQYLVKTLAIQSSQQAMSTKLSKLAQASDDLCSRLGAALTTVQTEEADTLRLLKQVFRCIELNTIEFIFF